MNILMSLFCYLVLFKLYESLVLNYKVFVGKLLKSPRRKRKYKIVTGAGVTMVLALMFGKYGWGAEVAVICLMVLTGFIDDWRNLPAGIRLVLYGFGVFVILYGQGWLVMGYPLFIICFLLYLGFVNAVNFMDGINGMVIFQFVIVLLAMLMSNAWIEVSNFLQLLLGFALAFLFYNLRNRSKLFMGDAGSIGIGFVLMSLFLWKIKDGLSWGYLSYFLIIFSDTSVVLVKRFFRGENVFHKHQQHLYQRLVNELGLNPVSVSVIYAIIQSVIIVIWEYRLRLYKFWIPCLTLEILMVVLGIILIHNWISKQTLNK